MRGITLAGEQDQTRSGTFVTHLLRKMTWYSAHRTSGVDAASQPRSVLADASSLAGGRIYLPSFAKAVFSAEFNKSNIRYAFVTEIA
jgi:hypothetical protein